MTLDLHSYRHDEIVIYRPYACDVGEGDWLWQGTSRNRLLGHNLQTAELRVVEIPEMDGAVVFQVVALQGKLFLIFGQAEFYLVHDPATGQTGRFDLPIRDGRKPITWYGCKLPDERLIVFDRGQGHLLLFDSPGAPPRIVACPWPGDIWSGSVHSDGLVYIFLGDPARVIRFDPGAEQFMDERPMPWPEPGPSGRFEHDGVIYVADSAGGRLMPLDIGTQEWGEPIAVPDYGSVFGFIGGAFAFGGKGYFNLSTYAGRSRVDKATGRLILPSGKFYEPGDPLPTVDGRESRFMERYLVFDPETRSFEYLMAPEQPDGLPLLCYAWADETRFLITGFVLPWGEPGVPRAYERGAWLVLQSEPAAQEEGYAHPDLGWDRAAHLARLRRAYPLTCSLYLPEPTHSPPIVNMEGSAVQYPAGKSAEILRRAGRTDEKAYWDRVCRRILPEDADDATRFRLVLAHTQQSIYYNPIQLLDTRDAVAIHQSHDGRCGQGAAMALALFEAAGLESRCVNLHHHVVTEAFHDGAWHFADPLFFGADQPAREGRVLSAEELQADPYFADAYPQQCFAYDPELLLSVDNFQVQGYVFGPWGSEPYYSFYLGAPKDCPPTLPTLLPVRRVDEEHVEIIWSPSVKFNGGAVTYELRIFADRSCTQEVLRHESAETSFVWRVPERNRMYFMEVRAVDEHRALNPDTWYPAARYNFVFVPKEQYGWYGVL